MRRIAFCTAAAFLAACSFVVGTSDLTGGPRYVAADAAVADAAAADADAADAPADGAADARPNDDYAKVVRADGPVAYLRFDDLPGSNTARDEIRNVSAPLVGPAKFGVPGAAGTAVRFDGAGYLDLGDVFDFAGNVPYAFEAWVRPEVHGIDQRFVSKRQDSNPQMGYILYFHSDSPDAPEAGVSFHHESWPGLALAVRTLTSLPPGLVHLVLTVSYETGKGNAFIYVNGERSPMSGFDNTTPAPDTTQPLEIARYYWGTMDELAIYDKPLSPERILAHYRAGAR